MSNAGSPVSENSICRKLSFREARLSETRSFVSVLGTAEPGAALGDFDTRWVTTT